MKKIVAFFSFLTFFIQISLAQAPVNDECINAIPVNVSSACSYQVFSNENATSSPNISNPSCGNYAGGDIWFKAVVPSTGSFSIKTLEGVVTDGVLSVYTGNCNQLTEVFCNDDDGPGYMPEIIASNLTPGSVVYIRFWTYGNVGNGTFSICLQSTSICSNGNPSGCGCPTPGATDCYLLPDILAGKRTLNDTRGWEEHTQLEAGESKGLLRVDVSTPNVGWGPMEVTPTNDYICGGDTLRNFFPSSDFLCPDGSFPKRLINQRIYHKIDNRFEYMLRPAGFMQYHPAHGHLHLDGWGLYTLRLKDPSVSDTLNWPIVNSGIKVSFCLIDLTTCSGALGDCVDANGTILSNDSFANYGLGGGYDCGNQLQGISVGKVDIYGRYLDESFVKIPYEACNGEYYTMIQIDPDNHFLEMNENNNWLAAKTNLNAQHPANTNPYAYIFSSKGDVLCPGDSLTLVASGASRYQWSTGETTQQILVSQPGRYWVTATTPCGIATSDTLNIFSAGASAYPNEVKADTVCAGSTATLFASGNAHWYDAPVRGNLIHVGNNFQTGTLNRSITFYVADQPPLFADSVGAVSSSISSTGDFQATREDFLIFNAYLPFKLKQVTVYAQTAGIRYIQLRDQYGKLIEEKALILRVGEQTITLDFHVPAGLNHQLGVNASQGLPGLYTNTTTSANLGYPYKLDAVAHIVGSANGSKRYPFFYNWKVEGIPQTCNDGARLPLTATVAPNVTPSISGVDALYMHTDNPVLVNLNPPGGELSGNGVLGNTFDPGFAGVGVHQLTYVYHYGKCVFQSQIQTEVRFDSSVISYKDQLTVLGNPGAHQKIKIVSSADEKVFIRLLNGVGQTLSQLEYGVRKGNNIFDLNLEQYASGVYMLEVIKNGERKIIKLIR